MQTNFTLAQLADPDTAVSEKILRSCVHCGFCTATCPTYVLLGDELDSPRGRIYLIKDMLENDRPANEEVALHIDRCLSCLACMTTCPSGVDYMHLVDHARAHIEETYRRPLGRPPVARAARGHPALSRALPRGARRRHLRPSVCRHRPAHPRPGALRRHARPRAGAGCRARAMRDRPGIFPAQGERRGRVALLRGCAQSVLDPGINEAAIRLLTRSGVEVVLAEGRGLLRRAGPSHGPREESHAAARNNIDAWIREIDGEGLDAIVITTSGCGTTIKDYGFMFRDDPAYAEKAARVSALAKDITEYLETLDLGAPARASGLTVAYHAACSLQHGQQVRSAPKALLAARRLRGARAGRRPSLLRLGRHLQHAPAGDRRRLRDRKVANIEATGADVIAAGNHRLHDPDRQRHRRRRSSTRSNCSTGPMAARSRRSWPKDLRGGKRLACPLSEAEPQPS